MKYYQFASAIIAIIHIIMVIMGNKIDFNTMDFIVQASQMFLNVLKIALCRAEDFTGESGVHHLSSEAVNLIGSFRY